MTEKRVLTLRKVHAAPCYGLQEYYGLQSRKELDHAIQKYSFAFDMIRMTFYCSN